MFPQKTCLKLSFLLAFFSLPVLAQSYSHEFENPDGSSHLCTSDFSGNTGKTRCVKVPIDERIKHQKNCLDKPLNLLNAPNLMIIFGSNRKEISRTEITLSGLA
jgi:hypothetical protein